jgi:hypothetical protein
MILNKFIQTEETDDARVTTGGIPASAYNMRALQAAQAALEAGKPMQEAVETARRCVLDEKVHAAANQMPEETKDAPESGYSERRRYCEAVANLAHGNFSRLSDAELADVLKCVRHDVNSFREWLDRGAK